MLPEDYLKNLLNEYEKHVNSNLMLNPKPKNRKIDIGDVYEIGTKKVPVIFAIWEADEYFSDVIPMSFLYEFASDNDIVCEFDHVIRDKWILQLDLTITIPNTIIYRSDYVGKLDEDTLNLIEQYMNEEIHKINTNKVSKYLIHKFKQIEMKRHRKLTEFLFNAISNLS